MMLHCMYVSKLAHVGMCSQQTKCKRPIESKQSDNVRKAAKRACETGEETSTNAHCSVVCGAFSLQVLYR